MTKGKVRAQRSAVGTSSKCVTGHVGSERTQDRPQPFSCWSGAEPIVRWDLDRGHRPTPTPRSASATTAGGGQRRSSPLVGPPRHCSRPAARTPRGGGPSCWSSTTALGPSPGSPRTPSSRSCPTRSRIRPRNCGWPSDRPWRTSRYLSPCTNPHPQYPQYPLYPQYWVWCVCSLSSQSPPALQGLPGLVTSGTKLCRGTTHRQRR